jgi:protein kinase-like protein/AAA ATPase-like protein
LIPLEVLRRELPRRYGALRRAGHSGNAPVLRAFDGVGCREVALKLGPVPGPLALSDLGRELRLLTRVAHPNLVRVYALEATASGLPCLVMDWVGPHTLKDAGRRDPMRLFLERVRQIVMGLDAIHALGFLHGDVKPSHVLVPETAEPRVVLVDLGLARPFGRVEQLTGTPGFLAPEMLSFAAVDARSDWFSLGMTLLHCMREPVPRALRDTELALQSRSRWREAVQRAVSCLPRRLAELLEALLEPDREARPRTASELLDRLESPRRQRLEHVAHVLARPPLFGRRRALGRLLQAFEEVRSGGGRSLMIKGPEGSGKSRLLEEVGIEATLRGAVVLRPVADARRSGFEALLEQLEGELPRGEAPEPRPAGPKHGAALERDVARLLALLGCLERPGGRPVVVLLDGPPEPEAGLLSRLRRGCAVLARARQLDLVLGRRPKGPALLVLSSRTASRVYQREDILELGQLGPLSVRRLARWAMRVCGLPEASAPEAEAELPGKTLARAARLVERRLGGRGAGRVALRIRPFSAAAASASPARPEVVRRQRSMFDKGRNVRGPIRALDGHLQAVVDAVLAGDVQGLLEANGCLLRLLLDRGETDAARRFVDRFELGPEHEPMRAELLLLEGRAREALGLVRSTLASSRAEQEKSLAVEARLVAGRAVEVLGQPALAGRFLERALEEALQLGSEDLQVRCLRHLVSHAARHGCGAGWRAQAERWAEQLAVGAPRASGGLERARANLALAEWLWRSQRPSRARLLAGKALASFIRLGARLDRLACRKLLASPVPPRRSRTPRGAASL